jgi:predicted amidohydrolase YtcJ
MTTPLARAMAVLIMSLSVAGCSGDAAGGGSAGERGNAGEGGSSEGLAPDIVLVGGPVVSLASDRVAEGIAVTGDRVVAIGSEVAIRALVGPATLVIELGGRSVLPGLADNHLHSIGGGPGVDLSAARSIQDVLSAIAERAAQTPPGDIVVTNSDWHEGQLIEQRLPYRDDLDRAAPNHAVVVVRGGHEYILNSAALDRWGIDREMPDVPGGRIGRYADGRLNGELVDRAKAPVRLSPPESLDREAQKRALVEQYAILNRRGLTSVRHPGGSLDQYRLLEELKAEGRLDMRVEFLFRAPRSGSVEELLEVMERWPAPPSGGQDPWLSLGGVKLGVDGGFEGGLMREPYDEPWGEGGTFFGLQTMPRASFIESVLGLQEAGWRVATHAVGDAAIDLVLDAYEAAADVAPITDRRWVIEHGFMPRDDHFPRIRALGLGVTAQDHLYLAAPSLVEYWGVERAAWTTPLKAYLDADVPVSLGTDAPVVPYDPWWVLHHFTTRGTISAGVMGEGQRVSREAALRAMTEGYAWLTETEGTRGTLAPGMLADLVVTGENYLDCEDPCLETMLVDLTMVGGRIVWQR